MPDVTYDRFRDNHPEYLDVWRNSFMRSMICSDPPRLQSGFYISPDEPGFIDALVVLGKPVLIYCGTEELAKELIALYPHFIDIVHLNGWYEDSCFMVVHETLNIED
jgi:hypothetical protein